MKEYPKITVCLTSCGRHDLLERTLESFFKYNTYPIEDFMWSEDADIPQLEGFLRQWDGINFNVEHRLDKKYNYDKPISFFYGKVGQIKSIDRMYSTVTTPYIFHLEDDWLFTRPSFVEKSLEIMESHPEILQVHLREQNDLNGHPVIYDNEQYGILEHGKTRWHGFSLNPSLKRLSDYKLINGGYAVVGHEVDLSEWYYKKGFIAAILKEGCVKHIGQNRHVKDTTRL
jgi:hypothetical protein